VRSPSIAELRAVTQPAAVFARSGEHWAGPLYLRRLSPYLTRLLIPTRVTPNGVTWAMIAVGPAGAAVLSLPGLAAAVAAALLIQLQILLDCVDGELARWRRATGSPVGVYLDKLAHWVTEAAVAIAIGVRADGGWDEIGGYTTLGLLAAVLMSLIKGETLMVAAARAEAGRPPAEDTVAVAAPRASGLRRLRRAVRFVPLYRVFHAVEATLLAVVAAIVDAAAGDLTGSRVLVWGLVGLAAVTAAGHLVAILTSDRLR
jgi:phosphatidylglycerophosphate synthase